MIVNSEPPTTCRFYSFKHDTVFLNAWNSPHSQAALLLLFLPEIVWQIAAIPILSICFVCSLGRHQSTRSFIQLFTLHIPLFPHTALSKSVTLTH